VLALPPNPALVALLRPRAWPKLALPVGAGLSAAVGAGYPPSLEALACVVVFLVGDAMLIFAANDLVDERADRARRALEAAPTPKPLLDGVVTRRAMGTAALLGVVAVLTAGQALSTLTGKAAPTALAIAAIGCVVLYEFAPFRLNYRGGGELVEALGVGLVLPLFGAAAFGAGAPRSLGFLLPALTAVALASAIGSTLADARADAVGGKRTFAVRFGAKAAARAVALTATAGSIGAFAVSLAGRPSSALVAIAIGATFGPVVRAARTWDGQASEGLAVLKAAVRRLVQAAWISAAFGFSLDRVFA
jgi:1,4-dihydroxy-2-naphthoate octaprenyltransferase/chlorophyll synthase